ncbi:response regulator [Thermodesulfobacterium hydrogeniphilum]|uniref:response regulator n=1 Tax=Thermodesulfobacterium hydrogeniphilum TaxID=161156 RepID=UPI000570E332|nr:response regulator transcription factor [Thermodesulfobacterium hydrogeniphilum]
MESVKILIIEDEKDIVELVAYNLKKENFIVDYSYNGEEGLNKIRSNKYDLIILDIMLPGIGGFELCKKLKEDPKTAHLPIIILTAKTLEADKILGLELGADDYITKPFSPRELIARIKAVLRRTKPISPNTEKIIQIGNLKINKDKYLVTLKDKPIELSATEFKILLYLAENKGRVYTREQLIEAIWGSDVYINPRTIDVHIKRLRAQIEKDPSKPKYIKTKRGIGYYIPDNIK